MYQTLPLAAPGPGRGILALIKRTLNHRPPPWPMAAHRLLLKAP
jgi:hypothetical protein